MGLGVGDFEMLIGSEFSVGRGLGVQMYRFLQVLPFERFLRDFYMEMI